MDETHELQQRLYFGETLQRIRATQVGVFGTGALADEVKRQLELSGAQLANVNDVEVAIACGNCNVPDAVPNVFQVQVSPSELSVTPVRVSPGVYEIGPQRLETGFVATLSSDGTVTVSAGDQHGLQDGDRVRFSEVVGVATSHDAPCEGLIDGLESDLTNLVPAAALEGCEVQRISDVGFRVLCDGWEELSRRPLLRVRWQQEKRRVTVPLISNKIVGGTVGDNDQSDDVFVTLGASLAVSQTLGFVTRTHVPRKVYFAYPAASARTGEYGKIAVFGANFLADEISRLLTKNGAGVVRTCSVEEATEADAVVCCLHSPHSEEEETERRALQNKCVWRRVPMVDCRVEGAYVSTRVMAPNQGDLLEVQRRVPARRVVNTKVPTPQLCTLRSFPFLKEHAAMWANALFESTFVAQSKHVNEFVARGTSASLSHEELKQLHANLTSPPLSFADCEKFAFALFFKVFRAEPLQLLHNFSKHSVTSQGAPFWSLKKRCPLPLHFDATDAATREFLRSAAHLRAHCFGVLDRADSVELASLPIPDCSPKIGVDIAVNDSDLSDADAALDDADHLRDTLPSQDSLAGYQCHVVEKSHVARLAFLQSAASLRARVFRLGQVEADTVASVCDRISPATTTALCAASALSVMSLQSGECADLDVDTVRTWLPKPPSENSPWNTVVVDMGRDCTVSELVAYLERQHECTVDMLTVGNAVLHGFAFGAAAKKRMQKRAQMPVSEAVRELNQTVEDEFLRIEGAALDAQGNDMELPTIRYRCAGWSNAASAAASPSPSQSALSGSDSAEMRDD